MSRLPLSWAMPLYLRDDVPVSGTVQSFLVSSAVLFHRQSVYSRLRAWTGSGVWEQVLLALIDQDIVDETTLMPDSTTVKVHPHASGVNKEDTTKKPVAAGED